MRYLVQALRDFGELLKGQRVAPVELYATARKSLHLVGYQGLSAIAVAGLDMAAWDALAKAAGVPLCVLLGGSIGDVNAYNSNGLWLRPPASLGDEALALRDEGGFTGLKLRLGRDRLADDIAALEAIRRAVGDDMHLMADFNQGLDLGEALQRCHGIDDIGLRGSRSPSSMTTCAATRNWPPSCRRRSRSGRTSTAPRICRRRSTHGRATT
jgi:mandelate racemase